MTILSAIISAISGNGIFVYVTFIVILGVFATVLIGIALWSCGSLIRGAFKTLRTKS